MATGAVVGTTDIQTLTNKRIDGAKNTLTNVPTTALASGPIAGTTGTFSGAVTATRFIGGTPLVYTQAGLATSGTADIFTTAVQTITDPFGTGVPYRCKTTYYLGYILGTGSARVWVIANGVDATWRGIVSLSSAAPCTITDMPAGGTATFRAMIKNLTATVTTFSDMGSHFMVTEVTPL